MLNENKKMIPVAEPLIGAKEKEYVNKCLETGWISSSGSYVKEFEKRCASFSKARYGISTCNGTVALHLALLAANVKKGDEVIVPTLTFISTANAVLFTGAKPIFVDSQKDTWNMDPDLIEQSITKNTKAIIPVHLFGHPADMDPIKKVARKYNLIIIEDTAEAHGAEYKGKPVGTLGDLGTFSFYGNKIITTGEGGMVLTNNKDFSDKIRILRDHGMSPEKKYVHNVVGYNYRLTNVQAAIGLAQMEKINSIIASKIKIAEAYNNGLSKASTITLPVNKNWAKNIYWLYSIILRKNYKISRDRLIKELKLEGIDSRPMFPTVHKQPIYNTADELPVAQELSEMGITLPSSPVLKLSQIKKIISVILKFA